MSFHGIPFTMSISLVLKCTIFYNANEVVKKPQTLFLCKIVELY